MTEPFYWRVKGLGALDHQMPKPHECVAGDEAGPDGVTVTHRFDGTAWIPVDDEEQTA